MSLYNLYLLYNGNNEQLKDIIKIISPLLKANVREIKEMERDDFIQECYIKIHIIFKNKPLKINKDYFISKKDYIEKYLKEEKMNFSNTEYYNFRINYRNMIGTSKLLVYLKKTIRNIKLSFNKKMSLSSLNIYLDNKEELIDYVTKDYNSNSIKIDKLLDRITDKTNKDIISMLVGNKKQNEIAKTLGISPQAVSKRIKKIKQQLDSNNF